MTALSTWRAPIAAVMMILLFIMSQKEVCVGGNYPACGYTEIAAEGLWDSVIHKGTGLFTNIPVFYKSTNHH